MKRTREFQSQRESVVERDGHRLTFIDRVNSKAHRDVMFAVHDAMERGYKDIRLDFAHVTRAYSDGMLPILCGVDVMRRAGIDVIATLPSAAELARLFVNTNWAHFLDPSLYGPSETTHDRHLAVRWFRTFEEQQSAVNEFLDVVMRNMTLERDVMAP